MDTQILLEKLEQLRSRDKACSYFGANSHCYILNPPISFQEIGRFEERYGCELPEEYTLFLTSMGNGGAGPYYGVFPLGHVMHNFDIEPWNNKFDIGNLAAAFPHTTGWNLPDSFFRSAPEFDENTPAAIQDQMMEDWDKKREQQYWLPSLMDGSLPVSEKGCALRQSLVTTGPLAGTIWNDDRADENGIYPELGGDGVVVTFGQWYEQWLDAGIASAY